MCMRGHSKIAVERVSMTNYRICGLTVLSELELPGAIVSSPTDAGAEVSIRRAPVPIALNGATATGPCWEMTAESFLLRIPRLARFLITAGNDIAVELEPNAVVRDAMGFVLGTAFGILLHQRGAIVLHGAAVAYKDRSIAICGSSGAGKSTLAAALCNDGCSFAADDLCVVGLDEDGLPIVLPDGRRLKLWKETIDRLDLGARRGDAVRELFEKYYIEPLATAAAPPKLSAIYVLRDARAPLQEGIDNLALPDALRTLEREAYRPGLRAKMGQKPELFTQTAAVLCHTKIFRLIRPRGFEHMAATVALLRAHWDGLG
jgi:hypothetical protein